MTSIVHEARVMPRGEDGDRTGRGGLLFAGLLAGVTISAGVLGCLIQGGVLVRAPGADHAAEAAIASEAYRSGTCDAVMNDNCDVFIQATFTDNRQQTYRLHEGKVTTRVNGHLIAATLPGGCISSYTLQRRERTLPLAERAMTCWIISERFEPEAWRHEQTTF